MNAFEDLMQNIFKVYHDALEPYIGESAKNEDQKWMKELEEKTRALTLARKTGNYSKLSKLAVTVKKEKLSEINKLKKNHNDEDMPAPTILPPKKRVKREKVSKIQKTFIEEPHRSSDVIIQEPVVSTIELLDSDDEKIIRTRSSRSRTKTSENPQSLMPNSDSNNSNATEYEDAVSEMQPSSVNSTFVLSKNPHEIKKEKLAPPSKKPMLNETVVIEKPTVLQQIPLSDNNLLTDDESMEEDRPVEKSSKKGMKKGNSYDNSPVKKKVEAYENLNHLESALPSKANTSLTLKQIEQKKGNVKEKALGFTPIKSKLPHKTGTPLSSLRSRTPLGRGGPTNISREQGTAERKTVESSEQKKKKYEETYLKAQQMKEREKEKALEMYKLKEERHKMLLQQKAEKSKQLKEEYERKRLLAKQKAAEQKNKEMFVDRPADDRENILPKKESKNRLIYMLKSPPRLPCSDCYDSDDERSEAVVLPLWAKGRLLDDQEKNQEALSHKLKNTLFCCQSRSVDLRELFGHVDPRKLKRTSSANWDKPPRFTMLSGHCD